MEEVNPNLLIPDKSKSLREARSAYRTGRPRKAAAILADARSLGNMPDSAWMIRSAAYKKMLTWCFMEPAAGDPVDYLGRTGRRSTFNTPFEGGSAACNAATKTRIRVDPRQISAFISLNPAGMPREAPAQRSPGRHG